MGYKPSRDTPPLERELLYLLNDLCIIWGFCIPLDDLERIVQSKEYTSQKFAEDVLKAEEMDSSSDDLWFIKISQKFIERFGEDKICVSTFVDRIRGKKEI
eukprot:gene33321-55925_t